MIRLLTPLRSNQLNQFYLYERYSKMFNNSSIEVITINPCSLEYIHLILKDIDGLFLCGGKDINPSYYGQSMNKETNIESDIIDDFEVQLIQLFYKLNKPIIGICRGIQTINVALGGTLHQHIYNHSDTYHNIKPIAGTLLSKYLKSTIEVNSYHHQSVSALAKDLQISALSDDGNIEAIEGKAIFACQWHPDLQHGATKSFIDIIHHLCR